MRELPKPFERYHHFKGKDYQILTLAKSAEDLRDVVVYQGLYEPYTIYVRDLKEFLSPVDRIKYPDAAQEERFARIAEMPCAERKSADNRETVRETNEREAEGTMRIRECEKHGETPGERAQKQKPGIDPVLLRFLDAETDDEKLTVLAEVRDLLTPEILTPMELSLGMEPQEEVDPDIRFKQIRNTLQYKQKYERSRRG